LEGTSTNLGFLTVETAGTIAPGASVGSQTWSDIEFQPGAVYECDVDADNSKADLLTSTGELMLPDTANSVTIKVVQTTSAAAISKTVLAYDYMTGSTNALVLDFSGTGFQQPALTVGAQGVTISLVPEPAAALAAIFALLLAARRK
ncbi:hypothetical protein GX586_11460, partial [bacterium]|nr:hypothetical protein [bacterium]